MAAPRELERLERQYEENPEGTAFAPLANAYRKLGYFERALDILQGGLFHHPDYTPARIVLARCHLDQGNDEAAEREFARVLDRDGENVIALQALADIAEQHGRYGDSERRLTALLALDHGNDAARDQLARVTMAHTGDAAGTLEGKDELAGALVLDEVDLAEARDSESDEEPIEELAIVGRGIELEPVEGLPGLERVEALPDEEVEDAEPVAEVWSAELEELGTVEAGEDAELDAGEMEGEPTWDSEPLLEIQEEDGEPVGDEVTAAVSELGPDEAEEPPDEVDAGVFGDLLEAATPAFEETAPLEFLAPSPSAMVSEPVEDEPEERHELEERYQPEEAEEPEESEPETVATETMAELYLSQGHRLEALGIYRMLAAGHPDDSRLQEKVRALEEEDQRPAPSLASRASDFAAASRGGQSVADFFRVLLSSKPDAEPPAAAGEAETSGAEAPPPAHAPAEGSSLGEPTRPAHDRLLLSAVFGEDASPVPPAVRGPGDARSAGSTGRFSFDAFFGGQRGETVQPPDAPTGRTRIDEEDLDQFQAWLQSLKG